MNDFERLLEIPPRVVYSSAFIRCDPCETLFPAPIERLFIRRCCKVWLISMCVFCSSPDACCQAHAISVISCGLAPRPPPCLFNGSAFIPALFLLFLSGRNRAGSRTDVGLCSNYPPSGMSVFCPTSLLGLRSTVCLSNAHAHAYACTHTNTHIHTHTHTHTATHIHEALHSSYTHRHTRTQTRVM